VLAQVSTPARLGWCCAAALAVFLLWIAAGTGAQVGVAFFYAVPVGLATWWFDWRLGLAFALACIALYAIATAIHPVSHFGFALLVRSVVLLAVVAAVEAARSRIDSLEHSAEELEVIRAALAPPSIPTLPGIDVAATFIPSELGVSGDFYLLTNGADGSTIAVVGDVVGHGPKAAQLATFIRARLATFAANSSDPAEILALANAALLERPGKHEELVSAVCLRFHGESKTLSWAAAGHPPPLRLPELRSLDPQGSTFLLGVEPGLSLVAAKVELGPDAGVLAYTDGATDLKQRGKILGLEGLQRLLAPHADLPAEALAAEAETTLLAWTSETIRDDLCLLVLRPIPS
jgi:serine phosphatase RsbU (regulator of sigma subunit)